MSSTAFPPDLVDAVNTPSDPRFRSALGPAPRLPQVPGISVEMPATTPLIAQGGGTPPPPAIAQDPGYLFSGNGTNADYEGRLRMAGINNALDRAAAISRIYNESPDPQDVQARNAQRDLFYSRTKPVGTKSVLKAGGAGGISSPFDNGKPAIDLESPMGKETMGEAISRGEGDSEGSVSNQISQIIKFGQSKGYSSRQINDAIDSWVKRKAVAGALSKGDYRSAIGGLFHPVDPMKQAMADALAGGTGIGGGGIGGGGALP